MSEKIAVHCKTKSLYDKVQEKAVSKGVLWGTGDTKHNGGWNSYKDEVCISIEDIMMQSSKSFYQDQGYTIISAESYLREVKDEVIFQVGDRVECVKRIQIKTGEKGRIVAPDKIMTDGFISVEWDNPQSGGHDCNGAAKDGHGYNIDSQFVKLLTNKPTTTKEEVTMNISDNFVEVFDSSAKLAKKMAARFGDQYGDNDRDLIALENDKEKLMAILEAEEEKEAAKVKK